MPIRNPFKRSSILEPQDSGAADLGFRDASVIGAKPADFNEPVEVQLSGENDVTLRCELLSDLTFIKKSIIAAFL